MEEKNFSDFLDELKDISNKLKDNETSMEDSINLFKRGQEIIEKANTQLDTLQGEVNKVLEDNTEEKM